MSSNYVACLQSQDKGQKASQTRYDEILKIYPKQDTEPYYLVQAEHELQIYLST